MVIGDIFIAIDCADGGTPMHPRYGSRKHRRTEGSFEPAISPSGLEIEEHAEGDGGGDDSNEGGANDVLPFVRHDIVADPILAKVVHTTHGGTGKEANDEDKADVNFIGEAEEIEGDAHDTNGEKEGSCRGGSVVSDLKPTSSAEHLDGSIADIMH